MRPDSTKRNFPGVWRNYRNFTELYPAIIYIIHAETALFRDEAKHEW